LRRLAEGACGEDVAERDSVESGMESSLVNADECRFREDM